MRKDDISVLFIPARLHKKMTDNISKVYNINDCKNNKIKGKVCAKVTFSASIIFL